MTVEEKAQAMEGREEMTYQELNRYFWIQKQIKSINNELDMLPYLSATNYDGMPHGTGISDTVHAQFMKRDRLYQKLEFKKKQAREELEKIESFLDSVNDAEIKTILRMRFINCRSYESIGDELFMDRRTVSRKIDRFFEQMPTMPIKALL